MSDVMPFAATVDDAVKLSGLTRTELYRLLGLGEIKAKKSGRRTLVLMGSVRDYVERLPDAGSPSRLNAGKQHGTNLGTEETETT